MRLTTKGRYAVTAMLDLAIHREQGPISLADISQRQGISLTYLEQLFGRLRKGMLVKSVRGPGGGYELEGTPQHIKIAHIIDAVNELVHVGVIDVVQDTGLPARGHAVIKFVKKSWADLHFNQTAMQMLERLGIGYQYFP